MSDKGSNQDIHVQHEPLMSDYQLWALDNALKGMVGQMENLRIGEGYPGANVNAYTELPFIMGAGSPTFGLYGAFRKSLGKDNLQQDSDNHKDRNGGGEDDESVDNLPEYDNDNDNFYRHKEDIYAQSFGGIPGMGDVRQPYDARVPMTPFYGASMTPGGQQFYGIPGMMGPSPHTPVSPYTNLLTGPTANNFTQGFTGNFMGGVI